MSYVISDACVACGACTDECPVNAILSTEPVYTIDESKCIDCGACAGICPIDCPIEQ